MRIQINKGLGLFKKGQVIEVEDLKGIPVDRYWRKRLKDAKTDKCCEILKPPTKPKTVRSNSSKGES